MPVRLTLKDSNEIIHSDVYNQTEILIGSTKAATIALQGARYNFTIRIITTPDGAFISSDDTSLRVNQGAVLAPTKSETIRHGDVIRIGKTDCKLHFAYQTGGEAIIDTDKREAAAPSAFPKYRIAVLSTVVIASLYTYLAWPSSPLPVFEKVLSVAVLDGEKKLCDIQQQLVSGNEGWKLTRLEPIDDLPSYLELTPENLVVIRPQEADTPENIKVRFNCWLEDSEGRKVDHHELTIKCQCLENSNPPVVDTITTYLHDGVYPNKISINIDAIDPDIPASPLRFKNIEELPANASINPITGLFTWNVSPELMGKQYSIPIEVFKENSPELKSLTIIKIICKSSAQQNDEVSISDGIFYTHVYKDDPNQLYPLGMAVAIGKNFLLTNAGNAIELAKIRREGWQVVIAPSSGDLPNSQFPVTDILAHNNFRISRERFGDNAYENTFFDLGIIEIEKNLEVIAETLQPNDLTFLDDSGHSVQIFQSNVDEILSNLEVSQMLLNDSVSIKRIQVQPENTNTQKYAVIEFGSFTPKYLDGALLFAKNKLLGIYSFTSSNDEKTSASRHFASVPADLTHLGTDSENSFWYSLLNEPRTKQTK